MCCRYLQYINIIEALKHKHLITVITFGYMAILKFCVLILFIFIEEFGQSKELKMFKT